MTLPAYTPPSSQRASVAAGLAPIGVLLAFTLTVSRLIDADTGLAALLACTVWVAWEMHDLQRKLDAYNTRYVQTHLHWRSSSSLRALVQHADAHAPTREFVLGFLGAERQLLRDGQLP